MLGCLGLRSAPSARSCWPEPPPWRGWRFQHRPPTLILWGPRDGYMPEGAARAYLRDLPDAELHVLADAGHWLLETHLEDAVAITRGFLTRVHSREARGRSRAVGA